LENAVVLTGNNKVTGDFGHSHDTSLFSIWATIAIRPVSIFFCTCHWVLEKWCVCPYGMEQTYVTLRQVHIIVSAYVKLLIVIIFLSCLLCLYHLNVELKWLCW